MQVEAGVAQVVDDLVNQGDEGFDEGDERIEERRREGLDQVEDREEKVQERD